MAEGSDSYLVRDSQGNVYGPANVATMREWIAQGRIVAGMQIALRDTDDWMEVSTHPGLADLLTCPQTAERPAPAPASFEVRPVEVPRPVTPMGAPVTPYGGIESAAPGGQIDYGMTPQQNVPAVISMIFGIGAAVLGLPALCLPICGCPVGGLLALVAIILGAIGLQQIKTAPDRSAGRGKAVAGLSLGIGVIVVYGLLAVLIFVFQMARFNF